MRLFYEPVPQDGELEGGIPPQKSKNTSKRLITSIISLAVLVFVLIIIEAISKSQSPRKPAWSSCGENRETALQRGCSFDLISFAWQTPECYDQDLSTEFTYLEPWRFYTEKYGNDTLSLEEVLYGENGMWVTNHFHIVHCTYMWRQMQRAYERGWIDAHLHSYNHTLHCQKYMLQTGVDPEEVHVKGNVIYPVCERVDSDSKGTDSWNRIYS